MSLPSITAGDTAEPAGNRTPNGAVTRAPRITQHSRGLSGTFPGSPPPSLIRNIRECCLTNPLVARYYTAPGRVSSRFIGQGPISRGVPILPALTLPSQQGYGPADEKLSVFCRESAPNGRNCAAASFAAARANLPVCHCSAGVRERCGLGTCGTRAMVSDRARVARGTPGFARATFFSDVIMRSGPALGFLALVFASGIVRAI